MIRTEYGSDFHFVDPKDDAGASVEKIYPDASLYFSGRSALFRLVEWGIEQYGWEKLYLPHYYCHEVPNFVYDLPIDICFYDDGPYNIVEPDMSHIDKVGNVYVKVNYFGFTGAPLFVPARAVLIEDHTHDLVSEWAQNSTAHYCFASLRKSLPIPAGGVLWSPKKLALPENTNPENEKTAVTAYMKLCAMLMKKNYLKGGNVKKQDFRALFIDGEQLFKDPKTNAALPPLARDLITRISVKHLRSKKQLNYKCLFDCIKEKDKLWVPGVQPNQCPFGLVFYFDKQSERDGLKSYLIERNIYPAILWLDQHEAKAGDFSNRTLLVHCDFRYTPNDMMFIADVINQYDNEHKSYFSFGQASME